MNSLFNLNKFRKIKENCYNKKEDCEKMKKVYYQTNPRYPKFNQMYFTAADNQDLNRYAFLPYRYFNSSDKSINKTKIKKLNKTLIPLPKTDIFKLKPLNKIYKEIDYDSIANTMYYMFNKFKKGVFVMIRDNKLALYLPFSNAHFKNNWYNKIYFSEEEKRLLQTNDYNKIKYILNKNIIEFQKKYPEQYKFKKINFNREEWVANGCFFRNDVNQAEGDLNINIYKNMFEEFLKVREVPDIEFFINTRDFPILKKDYTEPYFHLFDSDNILIEEEYRKKMAPILSKSGMDNNADILFPNEDDWIRASNKFFAEGCSGGYHRVEMEKWNTDWKKKINKCIFRGSATGCGNTLENNMRLKAADISVDNPEILDAGITKWNGRIKKYKGEPMSIIDEKKFRFGIESFVTDVEKSGYKYILNIDGHVSACRLSSEFAMNSVVLIVESDYRLWFSYLLKPYVHYVPVSKNLDNLISQIKWCMENDDECKKIAKNGVDFYNKYLVKDAMFDYIQKLFYNISNNKNEKNLLSIPKKILTTSKKEKIAIITCFRDSVNGGGERSKQREAYIHLMNRLLIPYQCSFKIFIIEQDNDGNPFNIGKLKNIGYELAAKEKFSHYIFSDIDIVPDYNLMKYLFVNPGNKPISLATRGTRYKSRVFMGTLLSFSGETFEKINGYPNNFWGWGGEDDALITRLVQNNINEILVPKEGAVIDFEEKNNTTIKFENKKANLVKEELKYEKLYADYQKNNWKNNGLSNLKYEIINEEKINNNTFQIKVNLLKEDDSKEPNKVSENKYKEFMKNIYEIKEKIIITEI